MEKKLTKSDFFWAFIRSNFLQGSWNMERMQALGFAFGMVPILKRLYTGEELKQAMKRHLEFTTRNRSSPHRLSASRRPWRRRRPMVRISPTASSMASKSA